MKPGDCPLIRAACPRRTLSEGGCPAWTKLIETNATTNEERITEDCVLTLWPRIAVELIKASNRPAAAIESTRNEIVRGFTHLVAAMPALVSAAQSAAIPLEADTNSVIDSGVERDAD